MKTITLEDAGPEIARLVELLSGGEDIVLTKQGVAVARLTPPPPVIQPPMASDREEASRRMIARLREGVHLGGIRATRDEMHEH